MTDPPSEPVDTPVMGAPGTGVLQFFPIFFRAGAQIQGLTFSLLPWGAPGLSAAGGLTSGAPQEPMLVLAYEWPVPWLRTAARLRKGDIESLHLHRFSTDYRLALAGLPFVNARPGGDPPDYEVTTDAGAVGIDCTALVVQERREAHALFVNLRRRIVALEPAALAHLTGFMVYLWFPGQEGMKLPFRPDDEAAVTELLNALATYRPNPNQLVVPSVELPETAPDMGMVTTPSGGSFYAVPHLNAAPDSAFSAVTGFELGLAYTTEHSHSDAWRALQRLVDKHDKEGVNWLLVSAGAPNRDGQTFPAEEVFAQFLIQHPRPLVTPAHVTRVILHLWSTGEAFDLLPSPTRIFGPLYVSIVPTHRPFQPQVDPV